MSLVVFYNELSIEIRAVIARKQCNNAQAFLVQKIHFLKKGLNNKNV